MPGVELGLDGVFIMIAMVLSQNTSDEGFLNELNKIASEAAPEKFSTTNNLVQLLGLILLLVIILFAAYYTSKFIGKMKLGQIKNSNFTVIDTYRIAPGKLLQIVKVGKKYIVISIAKDHVCYLTDIDETELSVKELIPTEKKSFRQIIDSIRNKE